MTFIQQILTIAMVILGTVLTRFVSFILFPSEQKTPSYILYLGRVLTPAIFGLLVIFSLKDTRFLDIADVLPKIIAVLVVILLHKWKKNTLLSIGGGTVLYMLLVQMVF